MDEDSDYNSLKNKNRILQEKLDKFQEIFKELMEEHDELLNCDNIIDSDSIIIERDNYGNTIKKAPSKLGDSYVIIDKKKDLSELDRDEYAVIKAQNDFHNYKKTTKYHGKFSTAYGWASTVTKYGKYAIAFL
jgi:hypothetical protein